MLEAATPHVLILAEPALAGRWAALLTSSLGAVVYLERRQVPQGRQLDLILQQTAGPGASEHGEACQSDLTHKERPAILAVGEATGGDIDLPADATDRELLLACRLLTALVRAKRERPQPVEERAHENLPGCDALTQLPNRGAWDRQLKLAHARALQAGEPLCVAILDLDYFKQINDGFGHAAGDETLMAFAQALQHSLRQGDFIARLGGDEFGLLLPGLDAASAGSVLERIRAGLPAKMAAHVSHVAGVSAGYCVFAPPSEAKPRELYRRASEALQRAKRQGRGRSAECEVRSAE